MTGPDHFLAAERLLDSVTEVGQTAPRGDVSVLVAMAQVHATLALAAATALADDQTVAELYGAWRRAAATPTTTKE